MYEFWYDYVKPKIFWKGKIVLYGYCFIAHIKTDDIYKGIAEDVETKFDTSNYELDRPLQKVKNKKVIGLMEDELGGKIMTKFVGLGAKTYRFLIDGGSKGKKAKDTKKCVIKRKVKFDNYKNCLESTQLENKINHLEKNKTDIDCFFYYKRKHMEFITNNTLILKTQQRFKSQGQMLLLKKLISLL